MLSLWEEAGTWMNIRLNVQSYCLEKHFLFLFFYFQFSKQNKIQRMPTKVDTTCNIYLTVHLVFKIPIFVYFSSPPLLLKMKAILGLEVRVCLQISLRLSNVIINN